MPTFLANFDFDDRLAGRTGGSRMPPPRRNPPPESHLFRLLTSDPVRVLVASLARGVSAAAEGPLAKAAFEPANPHRETEFEPWGWCSLADRLAGRFGAAASVVAAAERVNHRRFAAELTGGEWTRDVDAVLRRAAAGERLMMKSAQGGFGRGLRRILGPETDANLAGWVRRRCRHGGLLVEPLVPAESEYATHFDVGESGVARLGQTELTATEHGQFESSVAEPGFTADVPESVAAAAEAVRGSGYRCPLSIDSARLPGGGWRAVQDVNARWTVGRVALLASRRLGCRVEVRNDAGRWSVRTPEGDFPVAGR